MTGLRVFTIGHSNHSLEAFLALLAKHGVTAVADVRSAPFSRFCPQFNRDPLQAALKEGGILYTFLGRELGGRSDDPDHYRRGRICYKLMAQTRRFQDGVARVVDGAARHRIALTCAEKEPLDCHRTLLVAWELAARGVSVAHILAGGELEPHERTLDRLLAQFDLNPAGDLFQSREESREELLAHARERQAQRVAFRLAPPRRQGHDGRYTT